MSVPAIRPSVSVPVILLWIGVEVASEALAEKVTVELFDRLQRWVARGAEDAVDRVVEYFTKSPAKSTITLAHLACLLDRPSLNEQLEIMHAGLTQLGFTSPWPRSLTVEQYESLRLATCKRLSPRERAERDNAVPPAPAGAAVAGCTSCALAGALYLRRHA